MWLQRMSLIVLVSFCLYIGVLLAVLPWSPRFWDHNAWLLGHPAVFHVLRMGWARGLLSGLGLLDIWIGISEALHYRDFRPERDFRPTREFLPESDDVLESTFTPTRDESSPPPR